MPTELKAPRHDIVGLRGLTTDAQTSHLAANLLRVETASYLCYEMICHQNKVEPLTLDQFLKRAEERDALWRGQCALEDSKEAEELKKARELTRELAPKIMLDFILHKATIMCHDGSLLDPAVVSCPEHGKKNWEKWCRDQWAGSNTPTFDKEKLKRDIAAIFGPGPTSEHSEVYCFHETNVIPEYQPKKPKYPRFETTVRGPCMVQLVPNYWRWVLKQR